MATKSKSENISTLANRVYFAHKLIQIIDICNANTTLSPSSEEFKAKKQTLQTLLKKIEAAYSGDTDIFDEAMQAEKTLCEQNVLAPNGTLKSDEELLLQINSARKEKKAAQLKQALSFLQNQSLDKPFSAFLKNNGFSNIENLINKETSLGNPKKLREKLAQDFAFLETADPKNIVVEQLGAQIAKQTASLNFKYYYAPENPARNEEISQDFNTNENTKKKFLRLMGSLFGLGESLKRNDPLIDQSSFEKIRTLSGNPDLSDDAIRQISTASYNALCDGLWTYKNTVNADAHARKENYIQTNVSQWIKKLKTGKNYLPVLALLSPSEEQEYKTADERKQEEINKKHITIHHKLPKKYHAIFENPEDQFLINHISNFEMIIGGLLHNKKHEQDLDCLIKLSSSKDNAILCVPGKDFDLNHAKEIAMDIPEPVQLSKLRPAKTVQNAEQTGRSFLPNDNGITL